MKTIKVITIFMFVAFFSTGQNLNKTNILKDIDVKPPVFTGIKGTVAIINGAETNSIYNYLGAELQYLAQSEKRLNQGTEIVQFTVLTNGELDDFEIINSISSDIDREVIKILKSTDGMWRPGYNNATPVAMVKEIAIMFKMEYSDHLKIAKNLYKRGHKKLLKDKPQKALRLFCRAIVYQPYSAHLLFTRGLTRYRIGDEMGACDDWNRLKSLGSHLADDYLMHHCEKNEIAANDK